jgi:hypothetical protein
VAETYVYLVQCLCPARHCILAGASEATSPQAAEVSLMLSLRGTITAMLADGVLNPWCDLCHATSETWTYEVGRTPYQTLAEAKPVLNAIEQAQRATNQLFRRSRN